MLTRSFLGLFLLCVSTSCSSSNFSTSPSTTSDEEEMSEETGDETSCGESVCTESQICCQAPDPCADTCIVHCDEVGCPDETFTCNSETGSCLPPLMMGTGGAPGTGGANMGGQANTAGVMCAGTQCQLDQVCCTEGLCINSCVPNCNNIVCMKDRVCNTDSGLCEAP